MEDFTPKIRGNGDYVEVIIAGKKCYLCKKIMIKKDKSGLFPMYLKMDQEAQMLRAGIVYESKTQVDDKPICVECEQAGKATFECAMCKERRTTDLKQESFGDPAEFLCKVCYETVPAKIWDEKTDELYEEHKYDFE